VLFRSACLTVRLQLSRPGRRRPQKLTQMNTKALDKRNLKRTKMVVGLRLPKPQPQSSDLLVHTLDISSSGAKIGAVREWIEPGSMLTVQRRHIRAQCRVMWSRQVGPAEIQIGIEFLGHDAQFWGLDLDDGSAGVWLSASER
jgi:PilZ domain